MLRSAISSAWLQKALADELAGFDRLLLALAKRL